MRAATGSPAPEAVPPEGGLLDEVVAAGELLRKLPERVAAAHVGAPEGPAIRIRAVDTRRGRACGRVTLLLHQPADRIVLIPAGVAEQGNGLSEDLLHPALGFRDLP